MSVIIAHISLGSYGFQIENDLATSTDSTEYYVHLADSLIQKPINEINWAEPIFVKAHNLALLSGNRDFIHKASRGIHRFYLFRSEFDKGLTHFKTILALCDKMQDTLCMARSKFEIGYFNKKNSKLVTAIDHYYQAEKLAKNSGDTLLLWSIGLEKGLLYYTLNDSAKARKLYKKSTKYLVDKKFDTQFTITHLNIARTFNEPDSIIHYSNQGLKKCIELSFPCKICLGYLAQAHSKKKNPKKSFEIINNNFLLDGLEPRPQSDFYEKIMHTMGSNYYQLGQYQKAIHYFSLSAEAEKNKRDSYTYQILANKDLAKCYEQLGNFVQSAYHLKQAIEINEGYDEIRLKEEVAKIESLKALEAKEREIANLEEENVQMGQMVKKSKTFSYLLGAFLGLTLLGGIFYYFSNRIKLHKINEELSLSRLKGLQAMMNPHFLFNSFGTLQNYILNNQSKNANEYMTELSALIRNVLKTSDSVFINLNQEIELLKSYIQLEQGRFDNSFKVEFDIDEQLMAINPRIPSMIIQPHVENAILHGFEEPDGDHLLQVSFKEINGNIRCVVRDNGLGRKKSNQKKKEKSPNYHLSISTNNTKDRLRILNKIGENRSNVSVKDLYNEAGEAKGTEVVIVLPMTIKKYA